MKFDPKEAANKLIQDGEYDAQIMNAEETVSRQQKPMMKLGVKVWAHGDTFAIVDYAPIPKGLWKIRQICEALGLLATFETGHLDERILEGKHVRVFVKTRKDETGKYPDQNVITKYIAPAATGGLPAGADEDMPF